MMKYSILLAVLLWCGTAVFAARTTSESKTDQYAAQIAWVDTYVTTVYPDVPLTLQEVTASSQSVHLFYQQHTAEQIALRDHGVTVSVPRQSASDGSFTVSRVNSFTLSAAAGPPRVPTAPLLTEEEALDLAWAHLKVTGDLRVEPGVQLFCEVSSHHVTRYVYQITLAIQAPSGSWIVLVNAETGYIVSVHSALKAKQPIRKPAARTEPVKVVSRSEKTVAFKQQQQQQQQQQLQQQLQATTTATASVFNPDPVTVLEDSSLRDGQGASNFDAAYTTVTVEGITETAGTYFLTGDYIKLTDLSAPNTGVSTFSSDTWTATRGSNAFTDVMTYYHIDQNQRYIQSLGFDDIQNRQIEVDGDGVDGQDQSFFDPTTNSMEFGHGCVDDNEDAQVILHEYAHAMMFAISTAYSAGGDSGALGEGVADYWAASYKYAITNGADFGKYQVFAWDGNDGCWGGRRLDHTHIKYSPSLVYGAHDYVTFSDEVVSTPLYWAFLELLEVHGKTREEVDTIVLESLYYQHGMLATISAAAINVLDACIALHPSDPVFGNVFYTKFLKHNLVEIDYGYWPVLGNNTKTVFSHGDMLTIGGEYNIMSYDLTVEVSCETACTVYVHLDAVPTLTAYTVALENGTFEVPEDWRTAVDGDAFYHIYVTSTDVAEPVQIKATWINKGFQDLGVLSDVVTVVSTPDTMTVNTPLTLDVVKFSTPHPYGFYEVSTSGGSNGAYTLYLNTGSISYSEQNAVLLVDTSDTDKSLVVQGADAFYVSLTDGDYSDVTLTVTTVDTEEQLVDYTILNSQETVSDFLYVAGGFQQFVVYVPVNTTALSITTTGSGGNDDGDLYVRFPLTSTGSIGESYNWGSDEEVVLEYPQAGFYLVEFEAYSVEGSSLDFELTATITQQDDTVLEAQMYSNTHYIAFDVVGSLQDWNDADLETWIATEVGLLTTDRVTVTAAVSVSATTQLSVLVAIEGAQVWVSPQSGEVTETLATSLSSMLEITGGFSLVNTTFSACGSTVGDYAAGSCATIETASGDGGDTVVEDPSSETNGGKKGFFEDTGRIVLIVVVAVVVIVGLIFLVTHVVRKSKSPEAAPEAVAMSSSPIYRDNNGNNNNDNNDNAITVHIAVQPSD